MNELNSLFSPVNIGSIHIRNRLVMPAMGSNLADSHGYVTDALLSYYHDRSMGGYGLIVVENTSVHPTGKVTPFMLNLYDDRYIPGFKKLISEVHKGGARIAVQLNHAGRQTSSGITGRQPVAPSPIPCPLMKEKPKELTKDEIQELIEAFVNASFRAMESGSDAVEIHMAHGYLICQFLSSYSNNRNDEYGGSIENRTRFAREIVKGIKAKNGREYPIICRISADELVDGGLTIEESKAIVKALVQAGADAIHVSACNYETHFYNIPCYYLSEGCFIHLAEEIKSCVDVPVIAVGRIRSPLQAAKIVQDKKADLVAMGRTAIADSYLPKKAEKGSLKRIRPCLSCNKCIDVVASDRLECVVNPEIGKEKKRSGCLPTKERNRIWIIGAGPAGMEAARTAAERGYKATLFEQRGRLGGQLYYASLPPNKEHFKELINYYESELNHLKVEIRLNHRFGAGSLRELPDMIVIATGSQPLRLNGFTKKDEKIVTCEEALDHPDRVGRNIVIVGGGSKGAELADYFSLRNSNVTLIEMKRKIGQGLSASVRFHLEQRLLNQGVECVTRTEVVSIMEDSVKIREKKREEKEIQGIDTIILAIGRTPFNTLATELQYQDIPLFVIGDARRVGDIQGAINDGANILNRLDENT